MANRYWVASLLGDLSGSWGGGSTTNWSITSGGLPGASEPTASDNVIIDQAGSLPDILANTVSCLNLTVSASGCAIYDSYIGTLQIYGSVSLQSDLVFQPYYVIFKATTTGQTVNFATTNIQSNSITFDGVDGYWTLTGPLASSSTGSPAIVLSSGTLDTSSANNYAITVPSISFTGANTKSLILNASTVTLNAATPIVYSGSNLTFSAGTSTIKCNSSSDVVLNGGGLTYYNITTNSTSANSFTINGTSTFNDVTFSTITTGITISGANTFRDVTVNAAASFVTNATNTIRNLYFNSEVAGIALGAANTLTNLKFAARSSAVGMTTITLGGTQTISGTLTVTAGADARYRNFIKSATTGTSVTVSAAAVSLTDVDFQDINATGVTFMGTRLGNAAGNTGSFTFSTAKDCFWRGTTSANWTAATVWAAAASGGTADLAYFPLPQDTAKFPQSPTPYPNNAATVTISTAYNFGTIDMSQRTTSTMTLALGATNFNIYGNMVFGTGTTLTSTGIMTFAGRKTQQLTTAAKTFATALSINSPGGTVVLQDSCSTNRATNAISLTNGTLDLNGKLLTASSTTGTNFLINAGTKNITFNGGSITLSSTTAPFTNSNPTGFTTTAGTGTGSKINFTGAASGGTFTGGDATYYCTLNLAAAGAVTIVGSNTFNDITATYSSTGTTSVKFTAGTTTTFVDFNLLATSSARCTVASTTTSQATLRKASTWYMGANSVEGVSGSTSGLNFSAGGGSTADYLNISYITGTVSGASYSLTITEDFSANDVNSLVAQLLATISENISLDTAVSIALQFLASLSENITADQVSNLALQFLASLSEGLTAADVKSLALSFATSLVENFGAAEAESVLQGITASLAENIANADVASTLLTLTFTEDIGVNSLNTTIAALGVVIAENIVANNNGAITGGWAIISNTQNPSWTTVPTA
jgi:hypothetical protein